MQFIITGKAIDAPMAPPPQAIAAYKATFELLAAGQDQRIKGIWPHADERAGDTARRRRLRRGPERVPYLPARVLPVGVPTRIL